MAFEREIQTQEKSLHWISFNLKKIADELKEMLPVLKVIAEKLKETPF